VELKDSLPGCHYTYPESSPHLQLLFLKDSCDFPSTSRSRKWYLSFFSKSDVKHDKPQAVKTGVTPRLILWQSWNRLPAPHCR